MGEPLEKLTSNATSRRKPRLVAGEVILGRKTPQMFDLEDFLGKSVLINMSTQNIINNIGGKPITVRKKTELTDVVRTVIDVTHASVDADTSQELDRLVDAMIGEIEEGAIDLGDKHVVEAIDSRMPRITDTDLMRGMAAFAEAEIHQHQGSYEYTIIRPATLLAGWMIFNESEVRFV